MTLIMGEKKDRVLTFQGWLISTEDPEPVLSTSFPPTDRPGLGLYKLKKPLTWAYLHSGDR